MSKLSMIEGIGESYEAKLKEAGINSIEGLLKACITKKDRDALSERAGIGDKLILKWANHADLFRIKGIGGEYAELLEAAGVDTVPELANRNPVNLMGKIIEVNEAKKLVRKIPTQEQLEDWVSQAIELPRVLQY